MNKWWQYSRRFDSCRFHEADNPVIGAQEFMRKLLTAGKDLQLGSAMAKSSPKGRMGYTTNSEN